MKTSDNHPNPQIWMYEAQKMSNEGEKVQRGGGQLITQEEKNAKIAATDASKQM